MFAARKDYDLVLFGVTGFTGRLAAEHLAATEPNLRWAACARNEAKAKKVLEEVNATPSIEIADLICADEEAETKLRNVIKKTKVCATCAGPFEKYGKTLARLCAEEGVHYCDITGESDFVRHLIKEHDATARKSGACIVAHCGNDCVPWDLTVLKLHEEAVKRNLKLTAVDTFTELPPSFAASGGTVATAQYQLGKARTSSKPDFDPLVTDAKGAKSTYSTTNKSPKADAPCAEFGGRSAGPWIMGPVMANCVRRSNALLGYASSFTYSERALREEKFADRMSQKLFTYKVGAAILSPTLFGGLVPKPGEGPSRENMEAGWLRVHGRASCDDGTYLESTYFVDEDTGYLGTAKMLVACAVLLAKGANKTSGVVTPAVGLGSALLERLEKTTPASFEISEGTAPVRGSTPPSGKFCLF